MSNVILEFVGQTDGAQIFRHPVTRRNIRAGRNLAVRFVNVEQQEADYFLSLGLFRVAHAPTVISVPTRKDNPVRIEPVTQNTTPSPVEEPKENVVSFSTGDVENLVDWLSETDSSEVVVETTEQSTEIDVEVVQLDNLEEEQSASEQKNEKVRRGRPKN